MGFLCKIEEDKKNVSLEDLKKEKFLRDIGLNNVNNLNPEINFCQEIFLNPEYYVTGAIKLVSGYTTTLTGCTTGTTGIYNLDYTGDITLDFVITGETNYRDYEGNFCLKTFDKSRFQPTNATSGFINGTEINGECITFSAITKSEPDILKGEILVGTLPEWISLNTKDNLLYVSNRTSATISIIDADTNTVINTLTPGFTPASSAYDPVNNRLFIIERLTTNVHVLDCNTNTIITTFVGFGVANFIKIVYNPINLKMYVIGADDNVTRIICSTITLDGITTLTGGVVSGDMAYNSTDNTMYITSNATSTVEIVDCVTDTLSSNITFPYATGFQRLAYNSISNQVYVTDSAGPIIVIIDCNTKTYTDISTPTNGPYAIDFDSTNNNMFLSTISGAIRGIYRLDCTTNVFEKFFSVTSSEIRSILYNPINNTVYGGNYNAQRVIYITSDYVKKTFYEGSLQKTWNEYLVRPYFSFVSKECNPGVLFDSWFGTVQYNSFQSSTDYYFMTVVDPPKPILAAPAGTSARANQTLVTDRLYVNGTSGPLGPQAVNSVLNYFILSSIPATGQILLVVNGVQLTQGYDFDLISQGFGVPPIVEIYNQIATTDWVLATYISGIPAAAATNFGTWKIDTILVDGFTTTTTPSYRTPGDNTINYNPTTNNYEFFTSYPIDKTNSIILTVNGVKLAPDEQFFVSTSFDGRIIFDQIYTTLNIGDIISVLYATENGVNSDNYGSLTTNKFTAQWSVPPNFSNSSVNGRFVVRVYDNNTNNLLNQNYVDFVPGQSNYESIFTSLPLNLYFKFTVTFEATYVGYLGNQVITCSSAEGYFDTTNRYINNTY